MHNQPTALPDRREPGPVSPVIAGGVWLGDADREQPLTLQLRLPVSGDELAAALYSDEGLTLEDLADDEKVWGFAAAAIASDGLNAIQQRADEIALAEVRGRVADPAWLAACRRRVADVTGAASSTPATATSTARRAGAQPPSTRTTTYHRPRPPLKETAPPAADGCHRERLTPVPRMADAGQG